MTQYYVDFKDLGHDKIRLQGALEPGEIDFANESVRQLKALSWNAVIERAGEEIRVVGSLETAMDTSCSRCLEPARCEISKTFDLFFRQRDDEIFDEDNEADGEIELTDEDTRTAFFTGTQLQLGEILREQVLLALPMKALCKIDCKGLCPTCGTNLNVNTCKCPKERFSPHMDKLLDIKRKLEERSS